MARRRTKFAQGVYIPKNPEKYIGNRNPIYRSSWELSFMMFCDNNPAIIQWASEAIQIQYVNPFKVGNRKNTIYVPDFFIHYVDKNGKKHYEIIEIKPYKQTPREAKSKHDKMAAALNELKWRAARAFAKNQGMTFRVITERDIYKL